MLGRDFLKTVPKTSGVYVIHDSDDIPIYVGKAVNLRDRLRDYRNTTRRKKHRKMKKMIRNARRIALHTCQNEKEALLLENELIQKLRPKYNISGAFFFMYPVIGIKFEKGVLYICNTTAPEEFERLGFRNHGAFRSREITREAYFSLVRVLSFLGHREPQTRLNRFPKIQYSHLSGFRQLNGEMALLLSDFLKGRSKKFLEGTVEKLLEKPSARRQAKQVQEAIDSLIEFYRREACKLRWAMEKTGKKMDFLPQSERDRTFILTQFAAK